MFGETDALEFEGLKHLNLLSKHINVTKKTLNKSGGGTMSNESKIKYACVEALKKGAIRTSKPESGLFRGLKIRSEKKESQAEIVKFLLLGDSNKASDIDALNLDVYNIMSFRMQYGDTEELIVFKANDVDQEKAVETLKTVVKELVDDKRMVENDPDIIDVETYTELPAEFGTTKANVAGNKGAGNVRGPYGDYYGGGGLCGYNNDDWKKKQDEKDAEKKRQDEMRQTPTLIQRDGEKPQVKELNLMKKKIAMILAGEYEGKLIDLKELDEESDSDLDDDDECYNCTNATASTKPNKTLLVCRECDEMSNFNADPLEYANDKSKAAGGAHQSGNSSFMV